MGLKGCRALKLRNKASQIPRVVGVFRGLHGKGTFLAEDAAKIDQYLKQDLEWRGNKPDHELQKLDEVGVK